MGDYKISARIDLDQAQKDWDKLVAMADAAAPKIEAALKPSGGVSTDKQAKGAKETTKSFADLRGQTSKLIREMDELTRARKLDNVAVARAQRKAKELTSALRRGSNEVASYAHDMDRLAAKTTKFSTVTRKAQEATAGWWKRFGAVAVGFGIAYRAINVLENGLAAYVDILREGLTAQDEFIELQAKLAMYSQLYASNAESFAEGFQLAAVNVAAFRKELPMAISSLSDLTQGIDEFVQHGYAITPMTAHAMVNFLDFTAMIAVSVGSTAKQLRQEIQSLFEGAQKPGNQLLRLLKSLIPEFDTFIDRLRGLETETAMQELFEKISAPMDALKKMMLEMSATKAHTVWRKQLILDVEAAAKLAASMEGLAEGTNIFAMVFVRHMTTMSEAAKKDLAEAFIGLAHAFDALLDKSPAILATLTKLTWALTLLAELTAKHGHILLYASAIAMLAAAIRSLGTALMILPIAKIAKLGKAMQTFGKFGLAGTLGAGTIVHIANLMTKEFEMCAAAGVDLDNVLLKLKEDLQVRGEVAAVSAIQMMIDDGHEAAEILGLIAAKWDKTSAGGEVFWETVKKLNIAFDETTVLGKALKKMFSGMGEDFVATEGPMKEFMEWLEIYKENLDATKDATEILKSVTLSFYKDIQTAAKAGDVESVLGLRREAALELEESLKAVNEKIKTLQDAFNVDSENVKLALVIEQLRSNAKTLNEQLTAIVNNVPLFVARINELHKAFTTQISDVKSRAAISGKDLSVELEKICREFYTTLQVLMTEAGTLIDSPEIQAAYDSFNNALTRTLNSAVKANEKASKEVDELWTNAMDRVQSTFADTFMDFMKGELKSFKDVFESFCDAILRYWAETAAAMTMMSIFNVGGTDQQGWGGFISNLFKDSGGTDKNGSPLLQGASTAWSLQEAYSAYNLAGGGWGGVKAGAGSFFGMGAGGAAGTPAMANWSMVGGFPTATVGGTTGAAGAGSLASLATYAGYAGAGMLIGSLIDKIRGHDVEHPEYAAYGGAAGGVAGGFLGGMALGAKMGSWGGYIGAAVGAIIGGLLGSFMGGSKKRSYLTREYDYGYGLAGWEEIGMEETKVKREGADFREAAEGMSSSVVDILNSLDELTTGFLEIVGEEWVNQFKTSMMSLGELGFKFDISAEDKSEFEDDIEASFSTVLEGVINPVVAVATDFMRRATEEAFTSPEIEKVFGILRDDVADFLRKDMTQVLAIFDASLPTTQKEFEAYIENLQVNLEEVGAIIDYFQIITDITDEISSGLARSSLTQSLMDINVKFIKLGETLTSVGIDLEKYPDFVRAWGIALAEATYGFSVDNVIAGLKEIMDLPTAMEAAEAFTLGFMEQVRDGMVDAITSAFTEMIYAQMLAPLAEEFLAGAETPEELKEAAKAYIAAMSDLMKDPEMIDLLKSVGEMAWELNQMIPSAEDLAIAQDVISESAAELAEGGSTAGDLLVEGARSAANIIANMFNESGSSAIPAQHGLIATRPTYTHIAEAGVPEVVLPLDDRHKLTAQLENGGAQELAITIPLTIVTEDGRILKQETIRETLSELKDRSKHREFVIYATGVR